MPVPLLDVNAQNHPLEREFAEAYARVFRTGHFIMGAEVEGFEREVADLTGAKHVLGISSGTDAILLALMALGIGPGDEVLLPSFTFFATAGCVSRVGATPVFVDSDPVSFNLDLDHAASKVTPATKAIMPVHLFGQSVDMDGVLAFAQKHGLQVIEDAAQALGAEYQGKKVGSLGAFGCYSFFPSKNLGGLGDGGLLVTQDDALARKAKAMRNHGMEPKYYHSLIGGNFRLDALQAAFLRVKIPHYARYTERRRANARFYQERLSQASGVMQENPKLILPVELPGNSHIWNQFTLRVIGEGRRDALKNHLAAQKIGCEVYYPLTLDQQECFAHLPEFARSGCRVAHQLSREVLSIPIYPELSEAQLEEVAAGIESFLAAAV